MGIFYTAPARCEMLAFCTKNNQQNKCKNLLLIYCQSLKKILPTPHTLWPVKKPTRNSSTIHSNAAIFIKGGINRNLQFKSITNKYKSIKYLTINILHIILSKEKPIYLHKLHYTVSAIMKSTEYRHWS